MGKIIGRQVEAGFKPEATRDNLEASASYWLEWGELTFGEMVEHAIREQARGQLEDSNDAEKQKEFSEIEIETPITPQVAAYFFYAALGSKSKTQPESGVWEHTLSKAQDVKLPGYSLHVKDRGGGKDLGFQLGILDELTINYEMGEFAKFDTSWVSRSADDTLSLTPSSDEDFRFSKPHLQFDVANSEVKIKSLELNIANNVEHDDVLGDLEPEDFLATQFEVSGSVELMYEDRTYVDKLLNDTKDSFTIDMIRSNKTIGTTENPEVKINLPKNTFQSVSKEASLNDLMIQTFEFKSHYDDGQSKMIDAVVTTTLENID